MSQPPQPPSPSDDEPPRTLVRYDSLQDALGARRVTSQPAATSSQPTATTTQPVAPSFPRYPFPYDPPPQPQPQPPAFEPYPAVLPRMRTPPQNFALPPYLTTTYPPPPAQFAVPSGMPAPSWAPAPPPPPPPPPPTDAAASTELVRGEASTDKGKQREPRPRPPQQPDYHKLSQTYRLILDNAEPAEPSGLPADILSRIYECALEGVRQFEPPHQIPPPPRSPAPATSSHPRDDPPAAGPSAPKLAPSSKRQLPPAPESQKCLGCHATSTPEWRRGPLGPRTLCNACGLVYAKLIKKRGREAAGRRIMEGVAAYNKGAGAATSESVATGSGGGVRHPAAQHPHRHHQHHPQLLHLSHPPDDDHDDPDDPVRGHAHAHAHHARDRRPGSSAEGDGDGSDDDEFGDDDEPYDRRGGLGPPGYDPRERRAGPSQGQQKDRGR